MKITQASLAIAAQDLAPRLLGAIILRTLDDGTRLAGRIVETEAYTGPEDRASHAFGGRRTERNEMMYARPGTAYVYFTYGMHFMLNIACYRAGHPAAVLIRALEPLEGLEAMRAHRAGTKASKRPFRDTDLCSGPGKLCRALRIDRACNGIDLLRRGPLRLITGSQPPARIANGPRIGVDCAGPAWAARKLRWWEEGNPNVSA